MATSVIQANSAAILYGIASNVTWAQGSVYPYQVSDFGLSVPSNKKLVGATVIPYGANVRVGGKYRITSSEGFEFVPDAGMTNQSCIVCFIMA